MGKITTVAREDNTYVNPNDDKRIDLDDISISEVIEGRLFIGNLASAISLQHSNPYSITHILSVCPDFTASSLSPTFPTEHWKQIPIRDNEKEELLCHLDRAIEFIENAFKNGDDGRVGRVLVHCVMGVSRSAAVVCAYLMHLHHLPLFESISLLLHRRRSIHPNYGFLRQLHIFHQCEFKYNPDCDAYIEWNRGKKSMRKKEIERWMMWIGDVVEVSKGLWICDSFPTNSFDQFVLLRELGITHLLTLPPASTSTNETEKIPFSNNITEYLKKDIKSASSHSSLISLNVLSSAHSSSSQMPTPSLTPSTSSSGSDSDSDNYLEQEQELYPLLPSSPPSSAPSSTLSSPLSAQKNYRNKLVKEIGHGNGNGTVNVTKVPPFPLDAESLFGSSDDLDVEDVLSKKEQAKRNGYGKEKEKELVLIQHYHVSGPPTSSPSSSSSTKISQNANINTNLTNELLKILPSTTSFISDALSSSDENENLEDGDRNQVLIYCPSEVRACIILGVYLTQYYHISPKEAYSTYIKDALPLFDPERERKLFWVVLEEFCRNVNISGSRCDECKQDAGVENIHIRSPTPSSSSSSSLSPASISLPPSPSPPSQSPTQIFKDYKQTGTKPITVNGHDLNRIINMHMHVPLLCSDSEYDSDYDCERRDRRSAGDVCGYRETLGRIAADADVGKGRK